MIAKYIVWGLFKIIWVDKSKISPIAYPMSILIMRLRHLLSSLWAEENVACGPTLWAKEFVPKLAQEETVMPYFLQEFII